MSQNTQNKEERMQNFNVAAFGYTLGLLSKEAAHDPINVGRQALRTALALKAKGGAVAHADINKAFHGGKGAIPPSGGPRGVWGTIERSPVGKTQSRMLHGAGDEVSQFRQALG